MESGRAVGRQLGGTSSWLVGRGRRWRSPRDTAGKQELSDTHEINEFLLYMSCTIRICLGCLITSGLAGLTDLQTGYGRCTEI